MQWDIFCKVIDNHGDIGVCWRLSAELAARGHPVRLWVDDPAALAWMAPGGRRGVEVIEWTRDAAAAAASAAATTDAFVEAFGCDPEPAFVDAVAGRTSSGARQPHWINLEYLTAESFAERAHGLPSPVMAGPGRGLTKRFFYPGFSARTGGLIREHDLAQRQHAFDKDAWRARHGITDARERLVSLFCYEPPALAGMLQWLARQSHEHPLRLLVTAGRAHAATDAALASLDVAQRPPLQFVPLTDQRGYDELLWACELNFVRGEDSLVRALWAGRPLVWQLYPQHDGAHHAKLDAFMQWLDAPPSMRAVHRAWNGVEGSWPVQADAAPWRPCVDHARAALLGQDDLVSRLLAFASHPK